MELSTFTTTIIRASEGHKLTQADEAIDIRQRIICKELALGKNDTPDNWVEITEAEAAALVEAREATMANDRV